MSQDATILGEDGSWYGLFNQLSRPLVVGNAARSFTSRQIGLRGGQHLAKDQFGHPCILLTVSESSSSRLPLPVELENLRVEHRLRCQVKMPGGREPIEELFTVLTCSSEDAILQSYFLKVMHGVVPALNDPVARSDIDGLIESLVSLFRSMRQAPLRPALGLWAELYLIARSTDPVLLTEAWHNDTSERFDFGIGSERMEVKATSGRRRCHSFSFEQANPADEVIAWVVSILTEPISGGLSLQNLWDEVRSQVAGLPGLALKVDAMCISALGHDWVRAAAQCFDEQLACETIAVFNLDQIPKVSAPLMPGISDVRFNSDLSLITPVDCTGTTSPFLGVLPGSYLE